MKKIIDYVLTCLFNIFDKVNSFFANYSIFKNKNHRDALLDSNNESFMDSNSGLGDSSGRISGTAPGGDNQNGYQIVGRNNQNGSCERGINDASNANVSTDNSIDATVVSNNLSTSVDSDLHKDPRAVIIGGATVLLVYPENLVEIYNYMHNDPTFKPYNFLYDDDGSLRPLPNSNLLSEPYFYDSGLLTEYLYSDPVASNFEDFVFETFLKQLRIESHSSTTFSREVFEDNKDRIIKGERNFLTEFLVECRKKMPCRPLNVSVFLAKFSVEEYGLISPPVTAEEYAQKQRVMTRYDYLFEFMLELRMVGRKYVLATGIMGNDTVEIVVEGRNLYKMLYICRYYSFIKGKVLTDVWGADFPSDSKRFRIYYRVYSMERDCYIIVSAAFTMEELSFSALEIWASANFYERETWDMFGVLFSKHEDLRRILTDYGFTGHPLRKDFPVTGYKQVNFDPALGVVSLVPIKLSQEFRNWEFISPWDIKKDYSQYLNEKKKNENK